MTGISTRRGAWTISLCAAAVFAVHAACYLYFFVDDEAIPFVYARNLLRGEGLSYTTLEGRVEGYSDFLNVVSDAVVLRVSRAFGWPTVSAIDLSRSINFVLGVVIVILAARIIQRAGAAKSGLAAGLGFLTLAGPLALWSCSSLDAVPFALFVAGFASVVLLSSSAGGVLPVLLASMAMLERIDGFVYVGAVLVGALAAARPADRRWLLVRVVAPVAAVGVLYHIARLLYFGTILSAPLHAKVLYKLAAPQHVMVKAPPRSYLASFIDLYGVALVPALAVAIAAAWRSRVARAAAVATCLMTIYVAVVGDWMFGWRFCIPLLPLLSIVIASAVSRLRTPLAWAAAGVVVLWSAAEARTFAHEYVSSQARPIWWKARHQGRDMHFAPYGDLIALLRGSLSRGEKIAYNQAGLLPFVLDVDNIDDLGICSKFEAHLPTTDVYFTEVGRFSPLTSSPVFSAPHAYLLYHDVRMLISPTDLLRKANGGTIPRELLAGYYRLAAVDAARANAVYTRTEKDAAAFRRDPSLFRENLAHLSHVRGAEVDGARLPDDAIPVWLPFLGWQAGDVPVHGATKITIRIADRDEDVYALYAAALSAHGPVAVTLSLIDRAGHVVAREYAQADDSPAPALRTFDKPIPASVLSIEAAAAGARDATLTIRDLRVQGQSAQLRDYVVRNLKFPVN